MLPGLYESRILFRLSLRTKDSLLCRVDDDIKWAECRYFRVDEFMLTGKVDLSCVPVFIQLILLYEKDFFLGTGTYLWIGILRVNPLLLPILLLSA